MIKSMTGFSKAEASYKGLSAIVEIKSLNGRYLDVNCKLPKSLTFKELEVRSTVKSNISRGNVSILVTLTTSDSSNQFVLNEEAALKCFETLTNLRAKLKMKDQVKLEHLLSFSNIFVQSKESVDGELEWNLVNQALNDALKALDKMRIKEGQQILKDFNERMKLIAHTLESIENLGIKRIPQERERLRLQVAQLFESDEIDEHRLQMELVLLANKLDISEECVRFRSHIKFFNESLKAKDPVGQKLNFLLQEMNREVNTIGSKADDAEISQFVIKVKEELERIREQVQNIE